MSRESVERQSELRLGVGSHRRVLLWTIGAGLLALILLGASPTGLVPSEGGLRLAGKMVSAAFQPAVDYEASDVPVGAPSFLSVVLQATGKTLQIAAVAVSLSVVLAIPLGLLACCTLWACPDEKGKQGILPCWPCVFCKFARALITLLRSVHELIWAVVFLAAFGRSELVAAVALAIPYAGTLAKIFSEMIEEAPRGAGHAIREAGGSEASAFLFGLVPRVAPDILAYTFYRFECAVRSSAVLGFIGIPTIGYFLNLSFQNLHYREVWTYLYALLVLVILLDRWSGAIRRRLA